MAVDYKGQPITNQTAFTTTGIMNRKPAKLKPLKMPNEQPNLNVAEKATPDRKNNLQINLSPKFEEMMINEY